MVVNWVISDLIIEDTIDQEDEGSLLGVQDQEEDLQLLPVTSEETQNPGATENHKLSQCFKSHNPAENELMHIYLLLLLLLFSFYWVFKSDCLLLGLFHLWNFSVQIFESW